MFSALIMVEIVWVWPSLCFSWIHCRLFQNRYCPTMLAYSTPQLILKLSNIFPQVLLQNIWITQILRYTGGEKWNWWTFLT